MSAKGGRAEDFLALVSRAHRGRLKLYLGFAAGVGKTYQMLEEAHALRSSGVDIVLGFIETHGRAETAGARRGPARRCRASGSSTAASPSRRWTSTPSCSASPTIAVVDELAHTNVPGSRNRKRYQDVLELLDAGINVIGAFNVQHLESLNDIVSRNANVQVRETIPDSFLKQADQVVNLDLAVEDLLERLKAGKIYPADKVPWALEHFFQDQNLSTLRELSLREVAECARAHGAGARARRRGAPLVGRRAGHGLHVVASAARRHAAPPRQPHGGAAQHRLVRRLRGDAAARRRAASTPRCSATCTTTSRRRASSAPRWCGCRRRDPVPALLDFARSHGVGHIIIGRSHQPWWKQMLGRSVPLRLVREAEGFDLHIVSLRRRGAGVMTLRSKLLLAQLPLALALVLVGVRVAPAPIASLDQRSQDILKDNHQSVLAAQRMRDAADALARQARVAGAAARTRRAWRRSTQQRRAFEHELAFQEGNVTEPGERELTAQLRAALAALSARSSTCSRSCGRAAPPQRGGTTSTRCSRRWSRCSAPPTRSSRSTRTRWCARATARAATPSG